MSGKRSTHWRTLLLAVVLTLAASSQAQQPSGIHTIEVNEPDGQILSFGYLAASTEVELRGTRLVRGAYARMKIQSRPGFVEIDINARDVKGLGPASRFGRDFLTYVLWAVSVDGEPTNLGEIPFDEQGARGINVTTNYQTFWLMVTAEPDFAVNDPSPQVVLYSIKQGEAASNKAMPVPGKMIYHTYYSQYDTSPAVTAGGFANEMLQARKAVELASAAGILAQPTPEGEEPLPDEVRTRETLALAKQYLKKAESQYRSQPAEALESARTAAQIAENARALALGAAGGLYARQLERDVARARKDAEAARALASERGEEIARLQRRVQTLEQAGSATAGEVQRLRDQLAKLEQSFRQSVADLEASRRQLREDREKVCGELQRQLSRLGQLNEQGGSMVLTLASDILFDSGSAELRPVARENLARLATIRLLLFPDAQVRYEGHTDRVGDDNFNQWLSEQRAMSVYRYFLEERVAQAASAEEQQAAQHLLGVIEELLKARYTTVAARQQQRQQMMAQLGEAVVGMGERQPVEDTERSSERNRRVVLIFPQAQAGQASSICQPAKEKPQTP